MNYYLTLGIPMDADDESIRRAFRVLARRYHPDAGSGSSAEKFCQICEAYEALRDPARRARYDSCLQARPRSTRPIVVEPLRPEPTRSGPVRGTGAFQRNMIDDLFDALFDFDDDPFWGPLRR
jgi:curved DNA-binding protein